MLEIWLSFMAGLAGSGHCIGMCGGIAAAVSVSASASPQGRRFLFTLFYNTGRVLTYTSLGMIAGLASRAELITSLKPVLRWLFVGANLFVIVIGIGTALTLDRINLSIMDGRAGSFFRQSVHRAATAGSPIAALPFGLIMGFIPCGLVYGVLITAATSGSPVSGGLMMLAFGLGTMPVMLGYGQAVSLLSASFRGAIVRFMGAFVALLGAWGLWKVLAKMGHLPPLPF